ncbi:MAG: ImmA/IrrE family metallo-endopeptidase [Candidatus Bathyarchaeota archaeon]|nr:ImmA/IrrE family metallo-endopeptidase [Candidatus Termiticorpusculum sp.]
MVTVEPDIIDWVMHIVPNIENTSVSDTLHDWKTGKTKPTFPQIEKISKKTHIPLGYFFLKTSPNEEFPVLNCRTIQSKNTKGYSRNTIDTIIHMTDIQDWMRDYLIDINYDPLPFVGSINAEQNMQEIINTLYDTLLVSPDWHKSLSTKMDAFNFFREKITNSGILVMKSGIVRNYTKRYLNIEEFRAFTLNDKYAPLIFINSNDSESAKLFSLLHEMVHVFFGVDNFNNDRYSVNGVSKVETVCNAVAAEVLLPQKMFITEWSRLANKEVDDKMRLLSKSFKCGEMVVARKALDNHFINQIQYQEIVTALIEKFSIEQNKKKEQNGDNFYDTTASRVDKRFLLALDSSVREGKTQYTEAYHLTNTNLGTFSGLVDHVRGKA